MTMRRTMTWSFCDLHLLVQILRRRVARSSILYNLLGSSSLRPPLGRSFVALTVGFLTRMDSTVLMRLIEMRCRHLAAASETY